MSDSDYCYKCGDPAAICQCEEPRYDKDEYVIWARERIAALETAAEKVCAAINGLPVEEMVIQESDGSACLIGYWMQARQEWVDVMESKKLLADLLLGA